MVLVLRRDSCINAAAATTFDPKVAVVKDWGVTQLVTAEREITPHDLLSMTAGMTNTWWHRVFEPSVYGVVPQLYKDAGIVDDLRAPPTTLEENIKKLAQMPLRRRRPRPP